MAVQEAQEQIDERVAETRQMLDSWLPDYEVNWAINEEEARVTICDDMPHLGISGKTPGKGGSVLARRLVAEQPELPVGALADDRKAEEIVNRNFVGFVEKPIQADQLQQVLEGALD